MQSFKHKRIIKDSIFLFSLFAVNVVDIQQKKTHGWRSGCHRSETDGDALL